MPEPKVATKVATKYHRYAPSMDLVGAAEFCAEDTARAALTLVSDKFTHVVKVTTATTSTTTYEVLDNPRPDVDLTLTPEQVDALRDLLWTVPMYGPVNEAKHSQALQALSTRLAEVPDSHGPVFSGTFKVERRF